LARNLQVQLPMVSMEFFIGQKFAGTITNGVNGIFH